MKLASVLAVVIVGFWLFSPILLLAESTDQEEQVVEEIAPIDITSITHTKISDDQEIINFALSGAVPVRMFSMKGEHPRLVIDFPNAIYHKKNVITPDEGQLARSIRIGLHTEPKKKTRVVIDLCQDFGVDYKHTLKESENLLEVVLTKGEVRQIAVKPTEEEKQEAVAPTPESEPVPALAAVLTPPAVKEELKPATVTAVKPEEPPVAPPVVQKEKVVEDKEKELDVLPVDKKPIPPAFATKEPEEDEEKVVPVPDVAADVPQLLEVSFDDSSDRGEMVLFHLNDFFPPTVSAVEKNNPRVLCDFPNMKLSNGVQKEILAKGKYVESIRTSLQKDNDSVRVVLDLSPDRDYDLQQVFFKNDNLFVLIVNELHEASAAE